jgi:hypothetical protein
MTATARKVLSDLQAAHEMLEIESDAERFRVIWVAAMALSRAVGHVLQKVDSRSSPNLQEAINLAYASWQREPHKHKIFHCFIEDERNAVLKEYEIGFMSGRAAFVVLPDTTTATLSDELFCPLVDGPYSGEDCRDVLAMAIGWWHAQLIEIDHAAAA